MAYTPLTLGAISWNFLGINLDKIADIRVGSATMFPIDLKTLITLTLCASISKGVFLIFLFRVRRQPFLKWLAYGCFCFSSGWTLFLLRFVYGINLITLPIANILIVLMPFFMTISIWSLLGKAMPKRHLKITILILFFTFLFLIKTMDHKWIPGFYTSFLNGVFYLMPALLMLRRIHPRTPIVNVLIGLNFFISFLLFLRGFILGFGWFYPNIIIDESQISQLLVLVLFINLICIDTQVLFFPVLDFIESQKALAIANENLKTLSNTDDLTGLLNRRNLPARIQQGIDDYANKSMPFSVMLIDLDYFKKINDQLGHLVGDIVLHQVSQHMQSLLRSEDVMVRYGGEEFMVLLPATDGSTAVAIAERLRQQVAVMGFDCGEIPACFQVTASFGVATVDAQVLSPHDLLKRVDVALYRAKDQGRNRVCSDGSPG